MLKQMLKQFNCRKRTIDLIKLAFIIYCLFTALNCGKRKPPLPPLEKVNQRTEISAAQRGNRIILTIALPAKNADKKSILNIDRADIYRLAEPQNAPLTLSEEEFAANSTLIASVPITEADFRQKKLTYTDVLEFAGSPVRLRYSVRFVNSSGQKAALSIFFLIETAAKTASAPVLRTVAVEENAVELRWDAPRTNVDGSSPANILGYNIYRQTTDNQAEAKILNKIPVTASPFSDLSFEFGKDYTYFVRAVSIGGGGEPIESLDSNSISVRPKDVLPPTAPTAITVAAAPNSISIFFAVNPEKDIAGYRIYRSTDANLLKSEWTLLNSELLQTNTFQDKTVESGKTYFYYLKAVDNAGNVSQPSTIVSETAL